MRQLVFINIVIIIMDTALLSIEYASLYLLETVAKGVCYSIKLKLEFAILSRLVKFVEGADHSIGFITTERSPKKEDGEDVTDFVDVTKAGADVTHASDRSKTNSSRPGVDEIDVECARFEYVESAKWHDNSRISQEQ